jgi:hypothetical protein
MYRIIRISSLLLLQRAGTDCRKLSVSAYRKNGRSPTTNNFDDSGNRAAKVKYRSEHLSVIHLKDVKLRVHQLVNAKHGQTLEKDEMLAVKRELATTYYARCHSLLEEEYNHEKSMIDDRLLNWTAERYVPDLCHRTYIALSATVKSDVSFCAG